MCACLPYTHVYAPRSTALFGASAILHPAPSLSPPSPLPTNQRLKQPTVLVINTGGTLGMRKDSSGGLAPVPGYFTSQMLQMEDLVTADEMPLFDIVEYGM